MHTRSHLLLDCNLGFHLLRIAEEGIEVHHTRAVGAREAFVANTCATSTLAISRAVRGAAARHNSEAVVPTAANRQHLLVLRDHDLPRLIDRLGSQRRRRTELPML